jgi:7-carboxy-7-deazaguanine synthase
MDTQTIFNQIEKLSEGHPLWITLSGGNPAMQDFSQLIRLGQSQGYQFSMETQASLAQPWFSLLDQLTLSPKPPSTGMNFKMQGLERCLEACESEDNHQVDISLKFVAADEKDVRWSKIIADQYPELSSFIQPCNTNAKLETDTSNNIDIKDRSHDEKTLLWLIEATRNLHWHQVRVLPQLHRWLGVD